MKFRVYLIESKIQIHEYKIKWLFDFIQKMKKSEIEIMFVFFGSAIDWLWSNHFDVVFFMDLSGDLICLDLDNDCWWDPVLIVTIFIRVYVWRWDEWERCVCFFIINCKNGKGNRYSAQLMLPLTCLTNEINLDRWIGGNATWQV